MKSRRIQKLVAVIVSLMVFAPCFNGYATEVITDRTTFFGGGRYGVSGTDTDGNIFAGVINGRLVTCLDFESWTEENVKRDVGFVVYLNGKLCAVGSGYTYVYDDNNWCETQNNIYGEIDADYVIKNGGSVVVYVKNSGTYQSFDGITWKKVEGIPQQLTMYKINDNIVFTSLGYMNGLYFSKDGTSFDKAEINDLRNGDVIYLDNEYIIYDYREEDNQTKLYLMKSKDLKNWTEEEVPLSYDDFPCRSNFVNINGRLHALSVNGDDKVYENGKWVKGEYNMNTWDDGSDIKVGNPPFVYYNFSDFGIFAWDTYKQTYFIDNDGNVKHFDGRTRSIIRYFVKDDIFYGVSAGGTLWQSKDGKDWEKASSDTQVDNGYIQNYGTNGKVALKSKFIERGSRRFHVDNPEITAELQYPDGSVKKVAYEYAKDDYVTVIGGNGFFLLGGFDIENTLYYSKDGINRGEKIDFPHGNIVSNSERMLTGTEILSSADLSQFNDVNQPETVLVKLNDEYLSFGTMPVVENDRTLVPIRFLFERAGAEVLWDPILLEVTVAYGNNTVKVTIDSDTAYVNDKAVKLDVPARLTNDKTLVPLRFISENLGFSVDYNEGENTAFIKSDFSN